MRSKDPFTPFISNVRSSAVSRNAKFSWTDDVVIASDGLSADTRADSYVGTSLSSNRLLVIFFLFCIGLCALLGRAFYLQVVQGEYYVAMAQENRVRERSIIASRGVFFDRNGIQLVTNVPSYSLHLYPGDFLRNEEDSKVILSELFRLFQSYDIALEDDLFEFVRGIELILEKYQDTRRPQATVLAYTIPDELVVALELDFLTRFKGLDIITDTKREYHLDGTHSGLTSLSHVLGYVGPIAPEDIATDDSYEYTDYIGKTGIEYYYEDDLRGAKGYETIEVNALGQKVKTLGQSAPLPGADMTLTIDLGLQNHIEQITKDYLAANGMSKAAVVALDPDTGDVLAMVNVPSFDNNDFSGRIEADVYQALVSNPDKPLLNRAIQGVYPPGSTFKLIVGGAALQEDIVSKHTVISSTGGLRISQWFFPDWRAGGHGRTDLSWALADSVNTYFYLIGGGDQYEADGLGVKRISDYAHRFGIDTSLSIDLPGARAGFLPSKEWKERVKDERWYIGDTYHLAIGQGDVSTTPLHLAHMVATFANGGTRYTPHVVLNQEQDYTIDADLIDTEHIQSVNEGLREAVTRGSARYLASLPVAAAGKTGTAQWHSKKEPHAWFVGFAPYDNPDIAIAVLVEEGESGAGISVRIAKEVLEWYFSE